MCQEGEARGKNQEGESTAADERWIQFFCAPQFCGAELCVLPAAVGHCKKKIRPGGRERRAKTLRRKGLRMTGRSVN